MRTAILVIPMTILMVGCGRPPQPLGTITGVVVAGPVCPVESDPPDPNCAPRPVVGAQIVLEPVSGRRLTAVSDATGTFVVEFFELGSYQIVPQTVEGLMGVAPPFEVVIQAGANDIGLIVYDTGIR